MTDRFHAHDPLRLQGTIQQVVQNFSFRCRAGQTVPTEMASHELIRLQHPRPLTDRHQSLVEGHLQNALGRLAAGPGVVFFHRLVIDVANGECARLCGCATALCASSLSEASPKPDNTTLPILAHMAHIKPQALGRHVRQGVRPIFENCLVDALRLMQMLAPIGRNARVEDVVMAALDDMDGVDLHVAQVRHRCRRGLRARAEGFDGVQALGMQPDSASLGGGELDKRIRQESSRRLQASHRH